MKVIKIIIIIFFFQLLSPVTEVDLMQPEGMD
jgi:hypothetical protein